MSLRRVYETTFIVNAALEDPDIDAVIGKVSSYIETHGREIKQTDRWGRRRLAYPINKKFNGFYVHMIFEATPSTVPILERFMVLEDTVLRHLTLVLPQKLIDFREKRRIERGIVPGFGNETENSDNKHSAERGKTFNKNVNIVQPEPVVETEPVAEPVEAE